MKKLVIFDLDGTLANTLVSISTAANLTLKKHGFEPYEVDPYRYFVGNGAANLIRECLKGRGCEDEAVIKQVYATYQEIFEEYCMYQVVPYEGILQLLQKLKEMGIKMAVNTNKPQDRTIDVIGQLFGEDVFEMLVGLHESRERKPSPDGVFYILEELNIPKEDALYIGDTCTDMKTGKSAGLFTVGALWGFRDRAELEENHADAIISHPMELLEYL